jgi:hypothetical protein
MPLVSDDGENAALAACYGDGHAANWPASFSLSLFDGDPRSGGVELAASGGYAAVAVANNSTNFPAPVSGEIVTPSFSFPTSTGAWSGEATWWVLRDGATLLEGGELDDPVDVTTSGTTVQVSLSIFHDDVS